MSRSRAPLAHSTEIGAASSRTWRDAPRAGAGSSRGAGAFGATNALTADMVTSGCKTAPCAKFPLTASFDLAELFSRQVTPIAETPAQFG
jgi:hypothetical protein